MAAELKFTISRQVFDRVKGKLRTMYPQYLKESDDTSGRIADSFGLIELSYRYVDPTLSLEVIHGSTDTINGAMSLAIREAEKK